MPLYLEQLVSSLAQKQATATGVRAQVQEQPFVQSKP